MAQRDLLQRFDAEAAPAGSPAEEPAPAPPEPAPPPEPEPEAPPPEPTAAERLDAILAALADLSAARTEGRRAAERRMAEAFGRAAAAAVPALAATAFPTEVARAAAALAARMPEERLAIEVAPGDAEPLRAALARAATDPPPAVEPSDRRPAGTAALAWTDGGAEIAADTLAAAALDCLRAALPPTETEETDP